MKIALFTDGTVDINSKLIATHLSRLAPTVELTCPSQKVPIHGSFVSVPDTYRQLAKHIKRESDKSDMVLVFTEKPYDNNYFWDSNNSTIVVSLSEWEHLTNLSRNNGAVYFICAIIIEEISSGNSHSKNKGCINDFLWDKTGIDVGMRSAFICPECMEDSFRNLSADQQKLLQEIQAVLNELSSASRTNMDIVEYWSTRNTLDTYQVFICYNSKERDAIRQMNRRLKDSGIRTWMDEEQLPPGRLWQERLEEQIAQIKTAAIFVGETGTGPWQEIEIRAFLQEFVHRRCPVIPVILPECNNVPTLPLFLRQLTWVDFRKHDPNPFGQLLWGITGRRQ
jgi:hypothetical protein